MHRRTLPFPALVGQNQLKTALLALGVDPGLKGLLIRGERGTAKSTAARAFAQLLPDVNVVDGCRFGCPTARPDTWCDECLARQNLGFESRRPPFETLPLGVSEDQLLGSIDLERALRDGEQHFSPGLLARVNHGILYVDEVNLLEDHLVDLLLDVAATGTNVVAREGVSISHPANFLLVGTMNPEEGELRPQILDRFGLCVEIRGLDDPDQRAEVVSRRLGFEADPTTFGDQWGDECAALTKQITEARELLPRIPLEPNRCVTAAKVALAFGVEGHRADILMIKAAAALAALNGRLAIEDEDLVTAAELVLPHRLKRKPFEEHQIDQQEIRERTREVVKDAKKKPAPRQ